MITPFFLWLAWNLVIALGIISLVFLADIVRRKTMKQMDNLVAFTVWLIIAIVFLWFLPTIIESQTLSPESLWLFILLGIFLFYIFELFLHWHHCKDLWEHHHDHHTHEHKNNILMFTGTFIHNALHGVVLFSAFSIDIHFWIATTFAILLHAIPQNIANLLMNHRDVRFAYIAAFGWVFGALITLPLGTLLLDYKFEILAVIGWGLLYTAMSDILPSFKEKWETKHKFFYLIFMLIWVISFLAVEQFSHHEHDDQHHDEIHEEEHDDE